MKTSNFFKCVLMVIAAVMLVPLSAHARVVLYDADMSGELDINDVVAVIHYVLTGDASMISLDNADVNNNGSVDINDVTKIIEGVLNGVTLPPPDPEGIVTYTVNGVSFEMVPVEGGTFMMGSTRNVEEQPVHQVTLSDYWIGKTEVTRGLWRAVMGWVTQEGLSGMTDEHPVCWVSWDQCQEFVDKLNELTGLSFHLTTEAQWEFAACGGNLSHGYLYAGSDNIDEVACYDTNGAPIRVGRLWPNELGLYDMSGNVGEICQDTFFGIRGSYSSEPQTDPVYTQDDNPAMRKVVVRGGAIWYGAAGCTVTYRFELDHSKEWMFTGMRLALGPE